MGLMTEAAKQAEAALKKDRAAMEKSNHEQMAALAKIQPSPTIAEVQKAMGFVTPAAPVEALAVEEPVREKASEPDHTQHGGNYKTRAATPAASKKPE